jgi:hypothetical protein
MTLATTDRLRQVLEEHSTQTSSRGAGHFCRISNQEHHLRITLAARVFYGPCRSCPPPSAGAAGNNNNNNKAFYFDTLERVLHIIDDTDFVQQDGGPIGDEDDDWLGQ